MTEAFDKWWFMKPAIMQLTGYTGCTQPVWGDEGPAPGSIPWLRPPYVLWLSTNHLDGWDEGLMEGQCFSETCFCHTVIDQIFPTAACPLWAPRLLGCDAPCCSSLMHRGDGAWGVSAPTAEIRRVQRDQGCKFCPVVKVVSYFHIVGKIDSDCICSTDILNIASQFCSIPKSILFSLYSPSVYCCSLPLRIWTSHRWLCHLTNFHNSDFWGICRILICCEGLSLRPFSEARCCSHTAQHITPDITWLTDHPTAVM